MIKRIIEIASPAHLSLRSKQLCIRQDGGKEITVPIEDIGVLILDHPAITHTQGVLTACFEGNTAVIICDKKHHPAGLLLSMEGYSMQSRTIAAQIRASTPTVKRLWQRVVQAKVTEQARVLLSVTGIVSTQLKLLAKQVKSGDPQNIEAQAARIYWQQLFTKKFRRNRGVPGINVLLDYGYAILRASTARAIVGAGMHPSIGIHHHNQYNTFCLADDLMEPLRPLIDMRVHDISHNKCGNKSMQLCHENKKILLDVLHQKVLMGEQTLPLMTALHYYAASIRRVLSGEAKNPEIPVL